MANLFLRNVRVRIVSQVGVGKTLSGLRVIFDIDKTNEANPNRADVGVYNVNDNTKGILESKNAKVYLEVGYGDDLQTIFVGNVTKVVHENKSPDILTKIELGDGDNAFRNGRIEEGFPSGTSTSHLIDKLIEASGLGRGSVKGIPDINYANGIVLSGSVRHNLNEICKKNDLEWSIQDEAIQILPKKQFNLDSIVLLTPETGLVGSPSKTKKGIEFTSLLQAKLRPGGKVKIESRNYNGVFKVRRVNHKGDSHEGEFHSICEATL